MAALEEIMSYIEELQSDDMMPRNLKQKLAGFLQTLRNEGELSIKVDKLLFDLEEICNDINLPSFIRTQLWNVSCMLEAINN